MCTAAIVAAHGVPVATWPAISSLALFGVLLLLFRLSNRGARSFYLDPQDFVRYENGGGRELPVAASTGTFAPLLNSYLDVTKLLITVAAASIAFGGGRTLHVES
jgi:hypothetical protein